MKNVMEEDFFETILETVNQQMVVIDAEGKILWVNRAWRAMALQHGAPEPDWRGLNYLTVCGDGGASGQGAEVQQGLQKVIAGELPLYYCEYPCHSPSEQRWFMMWARPLVWGGPLRLLITHQNITERKMAEFKVETLARRDGLTGIANRRQFEEGLQTEWRRDAREHSPVSMLLIDVDHFKAFNDCYGHLAGDDCLRKVAAVLETYARRPTDLCARYGGEEFALIFGCTGAEAARGLAEQVRASVQALGIPHERGTEAGCVTVSIGIATRVPVASQADGPRELVEDADKALYEAKAAGRNTLRQRLPEPRGPVALTA